MNAEKMKYRKIHEFKLSAIGYGAMGLSHGYGACPEHKDLFVFLKKLMNVVAIFLILLKLMGGEKMKN